ncbi:GNAT family N-acetyltransferase [Sphingomonas sp. MAH-20]|uniref:GNAT family N-acetyltransferase n=1 Tax=Sphingomonas horti TaxID=2682842 RepID=A0A6I4J2W0_9SPHN|nr:MULTISPECIES: GNAT family N-acetyltransferase [Sphingomonas]MBA2919538.1 GNAT family N-acetyltransferase [Sphingomonas sp. CGMCC 1.13658]MVO78418.1 GNAT family N-acetyltransferase [Sphingomonas horti]
MFVRTDRLLLRPGWIEDAPELTRAVGDQAIARNTARIPWPYTLADAEAYLSLPQDPHAPNCLVFARTSGKPRLVGAVALSPDEDGHELGYWFARPYWGLGYATEAASALLRAARESLRLRHIHSGHFVDNPASGRVLRKLGLRPTGRSVRRHSVARGGEVDCLLYSDAVEAPCEEPTMRCLEAA